MSKPLPPLQTEATASGKSVMYTHTLRVVIECGLFRAVSPAPLPWKDQPRLWCPDAG